MVERKKMEKEAIALSRRLMRLKVMSVSCVCVQLVLTSSCLCNHDLLLHTTHSKKQTAYEPRPKIRSSEADRTSSYESLIYVTKIHTKPIFPHTCTQAHPHSHTKTQPHTISHARARVCMHVLIRTLLQAGKTMYWRPRSKRSRETFT